MSTYLCQKCNAPFTCGNTLGGSGSLANCAFTLTGFLCAKCGYYNNLKPRKKKPAAQPNDTQQKEQ